MPGHKFLDVTNMTLIYVSNITTETEEMSVMKIIFKLYVFHKNNYIHIIRVKLHKLNLKNSINLLRLAE